MTSERLRGQPGRPKGSRPRASVPSGSHFPRPAGVCHSGGMPESEEAAGERVWRALPPGTREALTRGLSPTDLQTLLLAVARERAAQVTPAEVARRWQHD